MDSDSDDSELRSLTFATTSSPPSTKRQANVTFHLFHGSDFRFACLLLFCPLHQETSASPAQLVAASRLSPPLLFRPSPRCRILVSIFQSFRLSAVQPCWRRMSKTMSRVIASAPAGLARESASSLGVQPEDQHAVQGRVLRTGKVADVFCFQGQHFAHERVWRPSTVPSFR